MNVPLDPELERRIRAHVETGDYASVEDFVQEAIQQLLEGEAAELADIKEHLRQAEAEIERGEGIEINSDEELAAFMRDIHERGLQRLAQSRKTGTDG